MQILARLLAAAASGALLTLALPPVNCWPLGWFALVPLLLAIRGQRFLVGFLLAILTGFVISWLAVTGLFYADKDLDGSVTWIQLGCAMFGAIIGIVAAFFAEAKPGDYRRILGLAAVAVLLEWMMLRILPVTLALTQADVAGMRMIASVVGIWGVSFLLWLVNLLLAEAISTRSYKPTGTVLVGVGMVIALGIPLMRPAVSAQVVPIVLVQSDHEAAGLFKLSGRNPAALAVWPEFGGIMSTPGGNSRELREMSARAEAPAIITSFQDGFKPLPRNVASLFVKGAESDRYAKRLLFGSERAMHTTGTRAVAVDWKGVKVGLNICFDSCSPGIMRDTAVAGAEMIALPTIDPPSPHHWLAAMHAAFTPFRSAELGIPIVRDDAFAYSQLVDAAGNVRRSLAPGENVLADDLPLTPRWTANRYIGDSFLLVCLALFFWSLRIEVLLRAARAEGK